MGAGIELVEPPDQLHLRSAQRRFRREVETIAALRHPGIVPVHAFGEERGIPYFAMELVDGCTLATALTSWAQLALLLPGLTRVLALPRSRAGAARRVARMLGASALSGAVAWGAFRAVAAGDGAVRAALGLAAAGVLGIGSYLAAAHALRLPELGDVLARVRSRAARPGAGDRS